MRLVLATIGSRGEVQPLVALARQLQTLDQQVLACVPPDFCAWIQSMEIPAVSLGPRMRPSEPNSTPDTRDLSSPEGRRQAAASSVAEQFAALPEAARGGDVLVATGSVMVAARSVAELLDTAYVHAHYCPATLPSEHHAPAPWPGWPQEEAGTNRQLWTSESQRWQDTWGPVLNTHRAAAGLAPVEDVRRHVCTNRPWLAADPSLGPWPEPENSSVLQTGAWMLPDERPLPDDLESFLDDGEPPVHFGLGSMPVPGRDVSELLVHAARALGRRAIISGGWADLSPAEGGSDCLVIGDTNHQALFPRVAAVVHHGGAGTTTAVARAGTPQVVLPQVYDQHYWSQRVDQLGIGVAHQRGMPTGASLVSALRRALGPDVAARACAFAPAIRTDGARTAAHHLMGLPHLRPGPT